MSVFFLLLLFLINLCLSLFFDVDLFFVLANITNNHDHAFEWLHLHLIQNKNEFNAQNKSTYIQRIYLNRHNMQ